MSVPQILRFCCVFLLFWSYCISSWAILPFRVTKTELAMMPEFCQAKYGNLRGLASVQKKYEAIYGYKNWKNMHHYCDAFKSILRANLSAKNDYDRSFYLEQARHSLSSLLETEETPDWPARAEAYVQLGKVLLRLAKLKHGSDAKAVVSFQNAIDFKPDYVPAYLELAEYYSNRGRKGEALGIVKKGLSHVPGSQALRREYLALGGDKSKLPAEVNAKVTAKPEVNAVTTEGMKPTVKPSVTPVKSKADQKINNNGSGRQKFGIPSDPYCRFCPDIDN